MYASPNPLFIFPGSTFVVTVTETTNASVLPVVTSVQLPSGITTTAAFPLTIVPGGSPITFQTTSTIAAGNYTLTFNGEAGSTPATVSLQATLLTTGLCFGSVNLQSPEIAIPFGGSGQIQITSGSNGADCEAELSVSGLPSGATASVTPQTITPGQSATVTISASATAPAAQNVTVTLTVTPLAALPPTNVNFLLDITQPPGSLPDNRTDYISTEDTPYAAVYDSLHNLIFASNNSWNRIDVISSTTHALVTRIPLRDPRGIDISQDNSTIWVASGSRQVFAINTATFGVTRYLLPVGSVGYWEGSQLLALSDGTLMIVLVAGANTEVSGIAIWNPVTNGITFPNPGDSGVGPDGFYRSGNGTRVYFIASDSSGEAFYYDAPTRQFSSIATLAGYALGAAINVDASRVAVCDGSGLNMYDGEFNLIGPLLPGCGVPSPPFFEGGEVFSSDNLYLYVEGAVFGVPAIIKFDANTLNVVGNSPAMPMIPVGAELSQGYYLPDPFAMDSTGMIFGLEDWGIAFDDGSFPQSYSTLQSGAFTFLQHMSPYFGPLSGGTTSSGFGNGASITPTVWYGAYEGTASISPAFSITSPPSSAPGPVNIKMLFPDGREVFDPLFFSYGPYLQYSLLSGAPPSGNVSAQLVGHGMPGDNNVSGTLTVGTANATLAPTGSNGLLFAGTPFPSKVVSYTVPSGSPGWANLTVTTPDGSSTLPNGMFYAQSVTDYVSSDTFTAILYDNTRQQLYLSAGDHIDVFSLALNQFVTPLTPLAQGMLKEFTGLALTPDGGLLLANDSPDGSLAVIDPDNPTTSYVIPIVAGVNGSSGCQFGPLYVATTANSEALVVTGGLPGNACGPGGSLYVANLTTLTAAAPPSSQNCTLSFTGSPAYVAAAANGEQVAIAGNGNGSENFCIYNPITQTYTSNNSYQTYGAAFSGDGNVAASEFVLTDSSSNVIGRVARPDIYYGALGTNSAQPDLLGPQLNAAGSLYYMAYSSFFDIVDVQHAILRMRFSLSETITNTAAPIAIDSGGRFVYLLTNKGLTIVDLGEAPLSIGWLNPSSASPGTQITVRGSGFDSSTVATVGGQAANVAVTDQNTLTMTVPNLASGPTTIILNGDGTSYTASGLLTVK